MNSRFYITTPIYYVNAEPHLGHAYTTVVADVQARFHRLIGDETFFLTGTDEHGDKIVQAAEKNGETPRQYVDRISAMFRSTWPILNIEPDRFIRTTDPEHVKTVQYILQKVFDKGDIEFREYEGLYCFGCERFLVERELEDGRCPDHKTEPVPLKEKNYFFLMSRYQDWLIDHIKKNPDFITPERYRNEVLSFLKEPLEDLCISRPTSRLTWGIPLPFDEGFVTYVWFDALINYLTGVDYPNGEMFKKFWPAEHVIAKDILKPHGIYWPCMLRSAGVEPYRRLHVHGYWKIKDEKMSKSLGNVVRPKWLVEQFGADAVRYCLMREMNFGLDAAFSQETFTTRINADLANDLGNLFSRTNTMLHKYRGGVVPEDKGLDGPHLDLERQAAAMVELWRSKMSSFEMHAALRELWRVLNVANKVIDTMAPWELARDDSKSELLDSLLYKLLEFLRLTAVLVSPVTTEASRKMLEALGCDVDSELSQEGLSWGRLEPGTKTVKIPSLFPRIDVKKAKGQKGKEAAGPAKQKEASKKVSKKAEDKKEGLISIDDVFKLELKVAEIVEAEPHPNADRLLKLKVKAPEERTIVAGIAEYFKPDELVGKKVVIVANLKPAKLRGVVSEGMLLAAKDDKGLQLVTVTGDISPGAKVS